jgi:hypothetical protein
MKEPQLRSFYELCQVYRHIPFHLQVDVAAAYNQMVDFVDQKEDATFEKVAQMAEAVACAHATDPTGEAFMAFAKEIRALKRV